MEWHRLQHRHAVLDGRSGRLRVGLPHRRRLRRGFVVLKRQDEFPIAPEALFDRKRDLGNA